MEALGKFKERYLKLEEIRNWAKVDKNDDIRFSLAEASHQLRNNFNMSTFVNSKRSKSIATTKIIQTEQTPINSTFRKTMYPERMMRQSNINFINFGIV